MSKRELDVENDTFSKQVPVCTVNREEKVPEQLKIFRDDPGVLTPCCEKIEVISWPYIYSQVSAEIPITPAVTNLSQSCNTKQANNSYNNKVHTVHKIFKSFFQGFSKYLQSMYHNYVIRCTIRK